MSATAHINIHKPLCSTGGQVPCPKTRGIGQSEDVPMPPLRAA